MVFGGFHDNLRDSKYFNDVYAFDLESRAWSKLSTTGSEPSPRSRMHTPLCSNINNRLIDVEFDRPISG